MGGRHREGARAQHCPGALTLCGVWTPLAPPPPGAISGFGMLSSGLLFCLVTAVCDMTLHGDILGVQEGLELTNVLTVLQLADPSTAY